VSVPCRRRPVADDISWGTPPNPTPNPCRASSRSGPVAITKESATSGVLLIERRASADERASGFRSTPPDREPRTKAAMCSLRRKRDVHVSTRLSPCMEVVAQSAPARRRCPFRQRKAANGPTTATHRCREPLTGGRLRLDMGRVMPGFSRAVLPYGRPATSGQDSAPLEISPTGEVCATATMDRNSPPVAAAFTDAGVCTACDRAPSDACSLREAAQLWRRRRVRDRGEERRST
jgi:hypothetical protein